LKRGLTRPDSHDASDKDSTLVARIVQDHYDALEAMFAFVVGSGELSTGYIKECMRALAEWKYDC